MSSPDAPDSEFIGEGNAGLASPDAEALDDARDPEADELAARRTALDAELQCEAEEFGLTSDDPAAAYGPNGVHVLALLGALRTIHVGMAMAMANAYFVVPEADYLAACATVERMRRGRWAGPLWFAEHDVSEWLAELRLHGDMLNLYTTVADAARNAVDAIILERVILADDFMALYWPWSVVMGWGLPARTAPAPQIPQPSPVTIRHRPRRRLRPRRAGEPDRPDPDLE